MNSCVLMARIVQAPERRVTQDNQLAVSSMLVEFDAPKTGDPPQRIKVVGWGNLAEEIHQTYQVGDQVILQGSLRMNTVDRPEGFKEKRAELSISRIYKQTPGMGYQESSPPTEIAPPSNVVSMENYNRSPAAPPTPEPVPETSSAPSTISDEDLDNIPF